MKSLIRKICSICKRIYSGPGNHAAPFKGRCCDECNAAVVLLARVLRTIDNPPMDCDP
jgi:hypothetical protein